MKKKLKDFQAKSVTKLRQTTKKLKECKSNYESQLQYIDKIDNENSELRIEIGRLNELNATLNNSLNDQKIEFEIDKENMTICKEISEKLKKENDNKKDFEKKCIELSEANDKITLLKKVNANLTNKIAQSRESIDTLKLEKSEIEKSKADLSDQKIKTENELHNLSLELKELKKQSSEFEIKENRLANDINLIKEEKEKLLQEIIQINVVNADLEAKVKQLDFQMQEKNNTITDLIKTKSDAEENLTSIRETNLNLETSLKTSTKRVETLEESIKKLQEEKSQELEKVKEAEASKKSIIEENSQLKTSIEAMNDKIQSQESDIKKLEDAKTNLKNVLNSTEIKNVQLELSINALENKRRQSKNNFESMKRARDDYKKDKEDLSKEVKSLKADAKKTQAEIKENEKKHQILVKQFKKTSKDNLLKYG